jgi:hypothetical protein
MSTNFPTSFDDSTSIPVESAGTPLSTNHVNSHTNLRSAILAIETIIGITASAVTSTFTYILSEVTGGDKAVGKTATQTITNKTLTSPIISSPTINIPSGATGDTYYNGGSGVLTRLAISTNGFILKIVAGVPAWVAETVTVNATTTLAGIVELATSTEITNGTATGGSGASLAITPDQLALSSPTFNGVNLTGLIKTKVFTSFESVGRFTKTITGAGQGNFNTTGYVTIVGGSGVGSINLVMKVVGKASTLYLGSPVFTCIVECVNLTLASGTASSFFGLGEPTVATAGHTYTVGHTGFKILKTGGVATLYATQADGTTENVSSALTTLVDTDTLELMLKINGTSSVDYWYRKNGGSLSSATNLTSNMPSGTSQSMHFSNSDNNADFHFDLTVLSASYER